MTNYYSAQSFLAWVLNTYFYDDTHYVYIAPFLPYRLPNPLSSSPYHVYGQFYRASTDADRFDSALINNRMRLRVGVLAQEHKGMVDPETSRKLKSACDQAGTKFFCPVLYRVGLDRVGDGRLERTELAEERGSNEYLIQDLTSDEFDILFFDYDDETLVRLYDGAEEIEADKAITIILSSDGRIGA